MCTGGGGGGKKGLGERRLRLNLTGVHISPFDSYKCCKYHLPIILGSEFEVQSPESIFSQGECTIYESH